MELFSIPSNPIPAGAVVGAIKAEDGVTLRFARWRPPPAPKGTVCLLQGRSEFIEKYFEVVKLLQDRGFAVATVDWRGQGMSQRGLSDARKGYVRRFSDYDLDLKALVNDVMLPDCPPPFFLLAHSMGAAVTLRALHAGRRWFERAVLSAPMIALAGRASTRMARNTMRTMRWVGLGGSYIPTGGATAVPAMPFAGNVLTSDPVRYERTAAMIEAAPELGLGSPTVAWLDTAYAAMAEFARPAYPRAIRQPVLIVAAGQDAVVSNAAIEQFAIRMRAGAHVIVPGARHELLMEQDRLSGQFWAAFDAFIPGSAGY
jgi:lysophospholipase